MKAELVFLPMPEIGHLVSMVELANQMMRSHSQLAVTILIPKASFGTTAPQPPPYSTNPVRFINLPLVHSPQLQNVSGEACYSLWANLLKPYVKQAITNEVIVNTPQSKLLGLVLDMFFTPMIDVANELGVPSYIYFPSSAAMLGLLLHLPTLHAQDDHKSCPGESLVIPSFDCLVPLHVLPSFMMQKEGEGYKLMLNHAKRFKETKGIIVNTLPDLEPGILDLNSEEYPPIYPVGPLLAPQDHTNSKSKSSYCDHIIKWLDGQPSKSVIFLCFGSRGVLSVAQVHEIAHGLERSGHRFLWSLRRPGKSNHEPPSDYATVKDALPDGFCDRTAERGLVCGWAPQGLVLGHPAVGGFVSHCGWNSILEGLWHGVPILAWPLYAEQKLNAYRLVKDLALAMAMIKLEGGDDFVSRDEVERAIKQVLEGDNEIIREKVKDIKEKLRKAVTVNVIEGGSSSACLKRLIQNIITSS